jgi:aldose 1-epimerase
MYFGTTGSGEDVAKITLSGGDLQVSLLTWGAVVQDVRLAGIPYSLTLGSDRLADYEDTMRYHGALIGPVANRISTAQIKIAGMMHALERNENGRIHLHSGAESTCLRVWDIVEQTGSHVTLSTRLSDGACGLPGNREIRVTYRVAAPATLTMEVSGTTDEDTAMNFANHSYWNLDGSAAWDGHQLCIAADHYLPTTANSTPTGEIAPVTGTDMDFQQPREITVDSPTLDHNFCLSEMRRELHHALTLKGQSGVTLSMATTEPGFQVYDGRAAIRPGKAAYEGLALEAQGWPDAPNHRGFPSIILRAGDTYQQRTEWQFSKPA